MFTRGLLLVVLALMGLGPGLFWSPKSPGEGGLSQGFSPAPLPQPLLEAKAKPVPQGLGVPTASGQALAPAQPAPSPFWRPVAWTARWPQRLYLVYGRLQTDGG
ncbi:hypothetical protein Mlute_02539 [Meiothermus luteus]|uniref:Uncharacterized protein n=1 Tax=Meiothermus luteus TaxID=2026184 RepID=A0A399EFI1_9DEIN|nr:hypothetical protein [Meiothermus luteus]RIH82303.1 hypothetical protein Mlute_02539 [Meiothermus luteus]RMH58424.1 MAG: hypothetical protein D6684_00770 [Deinococcota bacterium]